jgi:hypothetical protein
MFPLVRQSFTLIGMCLLFVLLCARAAEEDVVYDLPAFRDEPDELDLSDLPPDFPLLAPCDDEGPCEPEDAQYEHHPEGPEPYPDGDTDA